MEMAAMPTDVTAQWDRSGTGAGTKEGLALKKPFIKGYKMLIQRGAGTPMFIAALSTTAKYGKSPNVHRWMNV